MKSQTFRLEIVLERCLERMARGEPLEVCLSDYPEHADELRSMLQAAQRLQQEPTPEISPTVRRRARAQLLVHMAAHPRAAGRQPPTPAGATGVAAVLRRLLLGARRRPLWRPALALATMVVVLLVGLTATAQAALPDDPLYGWKRASERVWERLHPDPLTTDLLLAARRASELAHLSSEEETAPETLEAAGASYAAAVQELEQYRGPEAEVRIQLALRRQRALLRAAGVEMPAVSPPPAEPPSAPALTPSEDIAPTVTLPLPTATALDDTVPEVTPAPPGVLPLPSPTLALPAVEPSLLPTAGGSGGATPAPTGAPAATVTPSPTATPLLPPVDELLTPTVPWLP
ncbi:MAG: hypothetical protein R3272_01540 [Candidatus Promineifilaceae bacterium]|nr:hypothetical protein [Candidatus Promineifilaceae bacterium]